MLLLNLHNKGKYICYSHSPTDVDQDLDYLCLGMCYVHYFCLAINRVAKALQVCLATNKVARALKVVGTSKLNTFVG